MEAENKVNVDAEKKVEEVVPAPEKAVQAPENKIEEVVPAPVATPTEQTPPPPPSQDISPAIVVETPPPKPAEEPPKAAETETAAAPADVPILVTVFEEEKKQPKKGKNKRAAVEGEEAPTKPKKRRITNAMIDAALEPRSKQSMESSYFRWKEWEEGDDYGDAIFYKCTLNCDIMDTKGAIMIAKNTKVERIEWYLSRSAMIIFPDGKVINAIVCNIDLPLPLVSVDL